MDQVAPVEYGTGHGIGISRMQVRVVRGPAYFRHLTERIKGLCGAQPPHKPFWTNVVVLGGGRVVRNRGNLARGGGITESARYVH